MRRLPRRLVRPPALALATTLAIASLLPPAAAAQECPAFSTNAPLAGSEIRLRPGQVVAERTAASEVTYVNPFGVRRQRWDTTTTRYRFVGRTGEYTYGFEEITATESDAGRIAPTVLRLSYWVEDDGTTFDLGFLTLGLHASGGEPTVRVVAVAGAEGGCGP